MPGKHMVLFFFTQDRGDYVITIYDTQGNILNDVSNEEIKKLLKRNEAKWIDESSIQIEKNIDNINKRKVIPKSLKRQILNEEEYVCYICGAKTNPTEEKIHFKIPTIDHIVSIKNGGNDNRENLHCCCERCNKDKDNMDITEYYNHILRNRHNYKYISNKQLKSIHKECLRILKNNPKLTGIIDMNDECKNIKIYINNKESISINENDDIKKISVKIYKLLKTINPNYTLDIIN